MTAMPPLRNILNDTPATAVDIDWNFQTVEDYVATDVVKRDGSVAMEAPLNLNGPAPSQPSHAITKGYVDTQIIPIGTIWQFAGDAPPPQWALCDWSEHSSTDPAWVPLFSVIGFKYGQNGSNFRLPDLQGRVPVGRLAGDGLFGALGQKAGSRDSIVPTHDHTGRLDVYTGNITADHTHGMSNHQHYVEHQHDLQNHSHDSNVRNGYSMYSGNLPGATNAIYPPHGNTALVFSAERQTAVTVDILPGAQHQQTAGPNTNVTGWMTSRAWSDGPNVGSTGGVSANHQHPINSEVVVRPNGVSPTNGNVQPYTVTNFIIRIA